MLFHVKIKKERKKMGLKQLRQPIFFLPEDLLILEHSNFLKPKLSESTTF
jgi:hypothetical protein